MGTICCKEKKTSIDRETGSVHWEKENIKTETTAELPMVVEEAVESKSREDEPSVIKSDKNLSTVKENNTEERGYSFEAKDSFPNEIVSASRAVTEPIVPIPLISKISKPLTLASSPMSRSISISYSLSKYARDKEKLRLDVDESLVRTLLANKRSDGRTGPSQSLSMRLSLTRVSSRLKSKKKVRFNDHVVIHTIEYEQPKTVNAMSETYVLIVTMRDIWSRLDLDKDGHLNTAELKRFCLEVWEESDTDIPTIMDVYAKNNREMGINFHEWCSLVKDEDPEMESFIDDLYDIFVEPSVSTEVFSIAN